MNGRTIIRIYLTSGSVAFNDELINKLVVIDFKNRHKLQVIYFCFFLLLGVLSNFGYSFYKEAQIISIIYLSIDMFLLVKNVKFREQEKDILFYANFSSFQRWRIIQVGMINLFILLLVASSMVGK